MALLNISSNSCLFIVDGLSTSSCASWVQAWGSMLAIGVSVLVVGLGARAQIRNLRIQIEVERTADSLRRAENFQGLAQEAYDRLRYLIQKMSLSNPLKENISLCEAELQKITRIRSVINEMPVYELPAQMINGVFDINDLLAEVTEAIQDTLAGIGFWTEPDFAVMETKLRKSHQKLSEEIKKVSLLSKGLRSRR